MANSMSTAAATPIPIPASAPPLRPLLAGADVVLLEDEDVGDAVLVVATVDVDEVDVDKVDVELNALVWRIRIPGLEISLELTL